MNGPRQVLKKTKQADGPFPDPIAAGIDPQSCFLAAADCVYRSFGAMLQGSPRDYITGATAIKLAAACGASVGRWPFPGPATYSIDFPDGSRAIAGEFLINCFQAHDWTTSYDDDGNMVLGAPIKNPVVVVGTGPGGDTMLTGIEQEGAAKK